MATSLFDFDDVTTFGFAEDNNMIFTLDNVSKTNSKNYDDNADIDSASDNASESTIDGTTPDILSDEDGENAAFDFTSPTLSGLDEYASYNWSDFTYTPLDQPNNEFYFDSSSKLSNTNGSSLKKLKVTKRTNTKNNTKKNKRTIDFDSPTVSSSPVKKKQRTSKGSSKSEAGRLNAKANKLLDRQQLSKSLKVVLKKHKAMKNENGTKNAANRKKKSNAGKSSLNKKTKKDKKHKSKAASKKKSKKKNGKNATGSYSIKQKFTDGIPRIGVYTIPERKALLARFHAKRKKRVFCKKIKYECRKVLANDRPRVRGRFVKVTDLPRYRECLAKGIPFVPTPATK